MLRVNGMFDTSQFGTPNHTYPLPVKFGPDGSLYLATWGHDCCRAQLPTSQTGRLMRIDFIGDQVDTTAPVVDATVEGPRNGAGDYLGRATLSLDATDSSGISRVEYSLDGTEWTRYDAPVAFTTRGTFTVRYRATDRANNTSAVQQVAFSVVAGESCLPALSDEFGGTLDTSRWSYRHPTTPTGARAPSVADGQLQLPLGAFSLDLARTGPAAILAQPLPDGRLHAGGQDHRARAQRRHRRPGQHLRAGRPEALPDQRQLDQGLALAQRRRQPDGRDGHLLRARLRDQRHAHARHAHRPRHRQPADLVAARGPHRRDARRLLLAQRPRRDRRTGSRSARPTSTRSCRRRPARATSASTAATGRRRRATTTCASRRTRRPTPRRR